MQGEAACRAGEPTGQGEEPSPKGLGGRDLLAQTDPRRPAGQVVGHHLYRQPSAVGGEAAGRHVVQTDELEVSNGVLDLGVRRWSASSSRLSVPVGDEAVIAVWRRGPVGNRAWASPAGRSPHRCGAGLSPEGGVGGLRHHRRRRPSSRGPASSLHRESPRSGSAGFCAGGW